MHNFVAYFMAQEVMRQQFDTAPLYRQSEAPRLRWRVSLAAWSHPLAATLRATADRLEAPEPSGYAPNFEPGV